MPHDFNVALETGVEPGELSEIITHLAFYAAYSKALFAIAILKDIFAQCGIGANQLPPVLPELLPINQQAEDQRAAAVHASTGGLFPGLEKFTTELLFKNLWLRPGLAPRDRSLVTVSALIANGQSAQITFHLNKAMNNGLTRTQASEIVTQLAFYAGWPNAFSAVPIVKAVFESRREK